MVHDILAHIPQPVKQSQFKNCLKVLIIVILCRKPTEEEAKWPAYTLKEKQFISLSPTSSIQKNMLPEKMAFWNSFVPSLTEPQPTMAPIIPPTTKPKPVTVGPTSQKKAVASKGKDYLFYPDDTITIKF